MHAVIGDVCGHGAEEAALGVCLRVALAVPGAGRRCASRALVGLLEQLLMAERADDHVFATLTHLAFSADRRQVRMLQAGHPGLLLRSHDGVRLVEGAAGPAVGLVPSPEWRETAVPLPAGAGVLLYTDGLFEGRTGPRGQRLGEDGLLALAGELAALRAADFADALLERTELAASPYGGLADDVAVVHLGWTGPA